LAPLHNPAALAVIDVFEQVLPAVPQVAVFDTAFHRTMPPRAYLYPVPYRWYEKWGIQRFGFHGLSHAYSSTRAAEFLQRPVAQLKLVTCHLGSSASLAAVDGGRSVATTMGFTPLEGFMMGTRSGSVDPGLLLYLLSHGYLSTRDLEHTLYDESGLKGVSGIFEDMREVVAANERGHQRAELAFDLYTARIREGIGAIVAAMSGLDGLVFTAAVGEYSIEVRAAVCGPLRWLGVEIDEQANRIVSSDGDVATAGARVRVLVVHTREELMVATQTRKVLER
jgi:acetate kinase